MIRPLLSDPLHPEGDLFSLALKSDQAKKTHMSNTYSKLHQGLGIYMGAALRN